MACSYAVEGSVRRARDRVRITAQLIDAARRVALYPFGLLAAQLLLAEGSIRVSRRRGDNVPTCDDAR